jgi:hypothetical protein
METASMAEVDRYTFMTDYYGNHVVRMEDDHVVKDEEYVLATECDRLQKWVDDLQSGMYVNCVYCGHRYGPCETTPVSMADALKAHVEQCPKHPLFEARQALLREGIRSGKIEQECDRLRAALASIGEYDCPGGIHSNHCIGCAACDANKALSERSPSSATSTQETK